MAGVLAVPTGAHARFLREGIPPGQKGELGYGERSWVMENTPCFRLNRHRILSDVSPSIPGSVSLNIYPYRFFSQIDLLMLPFFYYSIKAIDPESTVISFTFDHPFSSRIPIIEGRGSTLRSRRASHARKCRERLET